MSALYDAARVRVAIQTRDAAALESVLAANNTLSHVTFPESGSSALSLAAFLGDVSAIQHLSDHGADINQQSGLVQEAPIHRAASRGQTNCVRALAHLGANVNAEGGPPFTSTPLLNAAQSGHLETTKLLIQLGAEPTGPPGHGSVLYAALYMRRASVVEYLLSIGVDVDVFSAILMGNRAALRRCLEKDPTCLSQRLQSYKWHLADGPAPLHFAILRGDISIVRLLCESGANPYDETESGMTAMCVASISAAMGNTNADTIIGYLRSLGVSTDLPSYVALGNLDQVRVFVASGDELRDPLALHLASFLGRHDIIRVLVETGIDVNSKLKSRPNESALACALASKAQEKDKAIQLLLDYGAKAGPVEVDTAILLNSESVLEMILRGNPNLNALHEGETLAPIHRVIRHRLPPALLEILLTHGADVNLRSGCMYQMTPLHLAVLSPQTAAPVVQRLLRYNADACARDAFFGERPLEWAKYAAFPKECSTQLVDLLQ